MQTQIQSSRTEQAQSMVEFALSIIIILILLVAVLDFGRAFFTFIALRDAAQEGALYGSICPADLNGITNRAIESSNRPVNLKEEHTASNVTVDCSIIVGGGTEAACSSVSPSSLQAGRDTIKVVVTYSNFPVTTPMIGALINAQTMTIRATVTDHILRIPTSPPSKPCP